MALAAQDEGCVGMAGCFKEKFDQQPLESGSFQSAQPVKDKYS